MTPHAKPTRNRRELITNAFCGFGSIALAAILDEERARAAYVNPLRARPPQMPAKAKSVIVLFMAGGPSHLETFDPKPLLNQLDGQPVTQSFGTAKRQFIKGEPEM